MFKTNAKIRWALFVLPVLALAMLGLVFAFGAPNTRANAQPFYQPMTLEGEPVSINSAHIVYTEDTSYTGSQKSVVSYIVLGEGAEAVVVNNFDGDVQNYNVTYTRNDQPTNDIVNVGTLGVLVEGMGNYTGSVAGTFTITPMNVTVEWADGENLVVDDTACESLNTGSGIGVFITPEGTNTALGDPTFGDSNNSLNITYYNTDKNCFSNGFTRSGNYTVSVQLNNPNLNLVGNASKKFYVKAKVLVNSDASIKVVNQKGFEEGVTLGEASITNNPYTIGARTDIKNKDNVAVMVNLTLYKNGAIYTPDDADDDLTIILKTGNLDYSNLKLLTNNGAETEFEPIEYSADGDTITLNAKALNTLVLATENEVSVLSIVTLSLTGLAVLLLIVLSFVALCSKVKKN